jgi:hypothetical protein
MRIPLFQAAVLLLVLAGVDGIWKTSANGRYAIHGNSSVNAWRIDTRTGAISLCTVGSKTGGPECLPWGSGPPKDRARNALSNTPTAPLPQSPERTRSSNGKPSGFLEMLGLED